jgi:hypothetical protein
MRVGTASTAAGPICSRAWAADLRTSTLPSLRAVISAGTTSAVTGPTPQGEGGGPADRRVAIAQGGDQHLDALQFGTMAVQPVAQRRPFQKKRLMSQHDGGPAVSILGSQQAPLCVGRRVEWAPDGTLAARRPGWSTPSRPRRKAERKLGATDFP